MLIRRVVREAERPPDAERTSAMQLGVVLQNASTHDYYPDFYCALKSDVHDLLFHYMEVADRLLVTKFA